MRKIAACKALKEKFDEILYPCLLDMGFKPHPTKFTENGKYVRDGGGLYLYDMVKIIRKHVCISVNIAIYSSEKNIGFQFFIGENQEYDLEAVDFSKLSWEEEMEILPVAGLKRQGVGVFSFIGCSWKWFLLFPRDVFWIKTKNRSSEQIREDAETVILRTRELFQTSVKNFLDKGVSDKHIDLDIEFHRFLKKNDPFWLPHSDEG